MNEQILTEISSSSPASTFSSYFAGISTFINNQISDMDSLRMVSFLLIIFALIMFFILIISVYIKNLSSSFIRKSSSDAVEEDDSSDIFNEDDALRFQQIIEDQERERELEKELQKELELAKAERESIKQQKKEHLQEQEAKKKKKENEKENDKKEQRKKEKNISLDLDWKKGKTKELDFQAANFQLSPNYFSYQPSGRELNELTGLIIDMLGRGVDELKIAQTIMYRNHYLSSEEDVLQLIDSIKDFIKLCSNQDFRKLPYYNDLPKEDEALYHLAEGDPTLALSLLESLMDNNIDKANSSGVDNQKSALYTQTSSLANIFGNIAAINDIHLATGSFELSIELSPHNIQSWNRLADMYSKADSTSRAVWAYQNVLKMADPEINPREVANASKHLSQHFYAQGNSLQAAKLYNNSKQFYDSIGINRRLDKQEIEIIEIIEANHQNEIRSTISRLLSSHRGNDFSI